MPATLEVRDGNPWYLSPDIWVTQTVGSITTVVTAPKVGETYNVVARVNVSITGSPPSLAGAVVSFYWGDPSTVLTPSTANLIGTTTVDLTMSTSGFKDVVSPNWVPGWVNNGHECLIVQVDHAADPITPPIGPRDSFDPPNHRQVAQLNLGVAAVGGSPAPYPFGAGSPRDPERGGGNGKFVLVAKRVPLERVAPILRRAGKALPKEMPGKVQFGIQPLEAVARTRSLGKTRLTFSGRNARLQGLALAVKTPPRAPAGTGALLVVEQSDGERVVGGIALLVQAGRGRKSRPRTPAKPKPRRPGKRR
jgi:hypothetical protein